MPADAPGDDLIFDYFNVPQLSLRGRLAMVAVIVVLLVTLTIALLGRRSADTYDADTPDSVSITP